LVSDRGLILFLPAILVVTFFADLGPAILTALLSGGAVAVWYFFLSQPYSFRLDLDGVVGLATFVLGSAGGIGLVHWLRATITQADAARAGAEALARQRELLLEAAPNGILAVDSAGRIRIVNNQLARMFGYQRDELIGQLVEVLVPNRFRPNHPSLRAGFVAHPSTRPMGAGRDLYGCRKDGSEFPVEIGLSSFTSWHNEMSLAIVIDITERKQSKEIEDTLTREIQHGSNNLLAVVQAIASRSFSGDYTLTEARKRFEDRLQALARANRRVTSSNWNGISLRELVQLELQPFVGRTAIDGINVMLDSQYAQNFSLALHELATNAAKYGALSNPNGKVGVFWTITGNGKDNRLKFKWQERGGPHVVAPTRHGFGTSLLKATFPDACFDYAIEGLSCEIDMRLGDVERGTINVIRLESKSELNKLDTKSAVVAGPWVLARKRRLCVRQYSTLLRAPGTLDQEVLENEGALTAMQRTTATQACYLAITLRPRRGFNPDDFVFGRTAWTIETAPIRD
jgi:PAS domain S-box-containing protein